MALIDAFLGVTCDCGLWREYSLSASCVAVRMTRSPTRQPVTGSASVNRGVACLGRGAELDPGAAQRRAVEVHRPAAADDGRARLLVHAGEIDQADQTPCAAQRSAARRADLQRPAAAGRACRAGTWASQSKAVLAGVVAGLNLDQARRPAACRDRGRR